MLGNRRIIGHEKLRRHMLRIVEGGRIGHAYLISGPSGVGKKALALAFAEAVNGVDNLTDLGGRKRSERRSWYYHPDIHLFLPLPSGAPADELRARIALLAADPYDVVDFSARPSISGQDTAKNKSAFYSVDYFNTSIRRTASMRPGEGDRNIVIITNIEKAQDRVINAFLKLLEEPGPHVMFILTTDSLHALLPTLVSRCQLLPCQALEEEVILEGLRRHENMDEEKALFLSRIAGGSYSFTRFYDMDRLEEDREDIIRYLRMSYSVDAPGILEICRKWHADRNRDSLLALVNMMEVFLRDIALYSSGAGEALITNNDRLDVIRNFCKALGDARINEMIESLEEVRLLLSQNIQPKLLFTVLSNRFTAWMRGRQAPIERDEAWKHLPAN